MSRRNLTVTLIAALFACVANSSQAVVIDPISATATSNYPGRPDANTINGSGLSGVGPVTSQTHDNDFNNMWLSNNTQTPTIVWDLGANYYNLTGFHMWNYNEVNGLTNPFYDRGVQFADVQVSITGLPGRYLFTVHLAYFDWRPGPVVVSFWAWPALIRFRIVRSASGC